LPNLQDFDNVPVSDTVRDAVAFPALLQALAPKLAVLLRYPRYAYCGYTVVARTSTSATGPARQRIPAMVFCERLQDGSPWRHAVGMDLAYQRLIHVQDRTLSQQRAVMAVVQAEEDRAVEDERTARQQRTLLNNPTDAPGAPAAGWTWADRWLGARVVSEVADDQIAQHLEMLQAHLVEFRDSSADALTNVFVKSLSYAAREKAHRESNARRRVQRWGRTLVAKLRALCIVNGMRNNRDTKLLAAAKRIQPVWRGAWTRLRLKRNQLDFGDDTAFTRVAFDDEKYSRLLRNTQGMSFAHMVSNMMTSVPKAPNFDVSAMRPLGDDRPRSQPLQTGHSQSFVVNSPTNGLGSRSLPGTPPTLPGGSAYPPSPPSGQRSSARPGHTREDEAMWGSDVAEQIAKRNAKRDKARTKSMRAESMRNPTVSRR
jgi:hypothetical protein